MHEKFIDKIDFDKSKILGKINNKILLQHEIEIPNEQRIKDQQKIDEIVEYQESYFRKNNKFNFLGAINIHYNIQNKKYYLVDGQHRFNAIKKLTNKGYEKIDVLIELIMVETLEELKENYSLINKNTELPDFPDTIDKNIPESVAQDFFDKYQNIWSTTRKVRRPHINKNNFQESLGVLTEKLGIETPQKLIKILEDFNERLKQWPFANFPSYKTFKDPSKIETKCRETGLYLGMFMFKDDAFGYGWVKTIIHEYTGKEAKNKKQKFNITIPKKIKADSWNRYIGKEIGAIKCICCRNAEITQLNFHGGHILAKSNGGKNTVDNIIPICSMCNTSMSDMEMGKFIKEYYPKNYENFVKKKYVINIINNNRITTL